MEVFFWLYVIEISILTIIFLNSDVVFKYNYLFFAIEFVFVVIKLFITGLYYYFKFIIFCEISIGYLFYPIIPMIFHVGLLFYHLDIIWNFYLLFFIYFLYLFFASLLYIFFNEPAIIKFKIFY